jgi:hypothetical protein
MCACVCLVCVPAPPLCLSIETRAIGGKKPIHKLIHTSVWTEEVKELERTAWLYESVQEQVRDN